MAISRLETSSSDEMSESRRQMSAWRRKYAALGIARPPVSSCNAEPLVRFPTNPVAAQHFWPPLRSGGRQSPDAHGLLEGAPHLRRLAIAMAERLQAGLEQRIFLVVLERNALDALFFLEIGQLDAFGQVRAADDRLGIAALRDGVEIVEQALADHRNAHVARADILLGAVGDPPLPDPGDDVLVDDVARNPAPVLALDRAHPGRDRFLHKGLASLRHAHEEPGDAQRVLVVDRHAPFEMVAEIEGVGPQRDAADGPIGIALVRILAHALVEEAVVELLELEL